MIYGYIRVSTDRQDTDNQKLGIEEKATQLGLVIDKWISDDGISGAKEPNERLLGTLLKKIKDGDVIIASEISRLGRKLFMVMRILEHCMKVGAKVYTVKDGYELGDNIQSKVLAFAFGLAAEIERDMISKRTKEALHRRRAEGVVLGRPTGTKNKTTKLTAKEKKIIEYRKDGLSFTVIGKLLKVHRLTVSEYVKKHNIEPRPDGRGKHNKTKAIDALKIINARKIGDYTTSELVEKYKSCNYSMTKMAQELNVSTSSMQTYLKRNGHYSAIEEAESAQRKKVKSKKQLERDSFIQQ